jgi:ppGpp synthetase/RelA/SpoT-type nucleotidyltranferase
MAESVATEKNFALRMHQARYSSGTGVQDRSMAFALPKFTPAEVKAAGDVLRQGATGEKELEQVLLILNNWRASHLYPINTFQATLRNKLKVVDKSALVGQRLKRAPSIVKKLQRFVHIPLPIMQDIAGLRAIVSDVPRLKRLRDNYLNSPFSHELKKQNDYVEAPKSDGYRSIHLIFKYSNDRAPEYSGLFVELQFRTKLQHAWATAVETVDTFMDESIKAGKPTEEWATFFKLASAAFSHLERTPVVEEYRDVPLPALREMLKESEKSLDVLTRLAGFSVAVKNIKTDGQRRFRFHLVVLNKKDRNLRITSYPMSAQAHANAAYAKVENEARNGAPLDPVLVTGGNVKELQRAFPNYFLDTQYFADYLESAMNEPKPPTLIVRKNMSGPAKT